MNFNICLNISYYTNILSGLKFIFLTVIFTGGLNLHAQVAINEDNSNPDPSAMLDVESTDKGMLVPRMTSVQRTTISSPSNGLLVFDTETGSFWFYANSQWIELKDAGNNHSLSDSDGDTKIELEKTADDDTIRFDTYSKTS